MIYNKFANLFSLDRAIEFLDYIGINNYASKLVKGKPWPYGTIYSLNLLKLEILKKYIKTHPKKGFIRHFKWPIGAFILFDKKSQRSLRIYVNYQVPKNLTIKNHYLLSRISKWLNGLRWANWLTQLNLTSANFKMRITEDDE